MKNYTITVNGTVYEVSVEEGGAGSAPVRAAAPEGSTESSSGSSSEGSSRRSWFCRSYCFCFRVKYSRLRLIQVQL